LAILLGLLIVCGVSALVGGLAGYWAARGAAHRAWQEMDQPRLDVPPWDWPRPEDMDPRSPPFMPDYGEVAALVLGVVQGSPAERAGLRRGDLIVAVDGEPLARDGTLSRRLRQYGPGDEIELLVRRVGREFAVEVRLGQHPDRGGQVPWLGVTYRMSRWPHLDTDRDLD
jgi:membrane-associated protease RseP (regulator of RpoE activity)